MKNKICYKKILFYIFLIIYIFLIGLNIRLSFSSGTESSLESGRVAKLIWNILNFLNIHVDLEDQTYLYLVRKLVGHFGLFLVTSLVGTFTILCMKENNVLKLKALLISLLIGASLAFLTEYFQSLSVNRGPSLEDSFIDISGYIIPFLVYFIFIIYKIIKGKYEGAYLEI